MPRNIELKARIPSVETLLAKAMPLGDGPAQHLEQDDTFFRVPQGRLKLRQFADGSGELIHYDRPDSAQAKASDYVRVPAPDPAALREALTRGLGVLGRVRKQRWLVLAGQTRIHIDRVEGLGDCLELEVVLHPGQSDEAGSAIAERFMQVLGLAQTERLSGAYLDLLSPTTTVG